MKALVQPVKRLLLQILLLLSCYFASRAMFTAINLDRFPDLGIAEFLRLSFHGLRYDLSAIVTINALYILLLMSPLPLGRMPRLEKALQWLFIVTNTIAFIFEVADWAYFPFSLKRSTIDVLDMITRKGDFWNLLPHFIKDYWFSPLGTVLVVFIFYRMNKWICKRTPLDKDDGVFSWKTISLQSLRLAVMTGICILTMRGGLQVIPIGNVNAMQVAESRLVPIVLNTPFSIMHSYSGKMEEVKFYPEKDLVKFFDPIKQYGGKPFTKKNVVAILLESFSKQYTSLGGRKSYTPFLDSIMAEGYVCTNAYANALRSAEGIPAVLSGMPALMDEPITTSSYGTDNLTSLPALLRDKGYQTAFYHGGTNGTMSFDMYATSAGFSRYVGRNEYNNEADYDGHWGIWDEPFLQFFANDLNKMQQPFMASVFTLSSHDPYKVPAQYEGKFPKGKEPVNQVVAYTDYALRKFFETASKQPWFENTLFVFTADHCSPATKDKYYSADKMGIYTIPIAFYAPGDTSLKGVNDHIVQQIDILPTVLDYLGYSERFFAFGNSAFRNDQQKFVINGVPGNYQWYMDGYLLTATETKPKGLYQFDTDSLCRRNLLKVDKDKVRKRMMPYLQAFVQLYRSSLIQNRLSAHNAITAN